MSRLTSSPSRGWGGAMPMRQVGRNCAAKPREHATLAPLHIFWRCRFSLLTCRKGLRSLASLARNSKKITYNDRARAATHHSGKVTRTRFDLHPLHDRQPAQAIDHVDQPAPIDRYVVALHPV